MKIGLISDTHGSLKNFEKVLDGPFTGVELILHAGDVLHHGARNPLTDRYNAVALAERINSLEIPIMISRGNCDSDVDQSVLAVPVMSPHVFISVGTRRIMVIHGDSRKEEDLDALIDRFRLNLLVHGHSHIARMRKVGSSLIVNPGTPTIPNPSSPFKKTVGLLDSSEGTVEIRDIETGKVVLEGSFEP